MRCRFSVVSARASVAATVDAVSVSKLPPEPCETESGDGATLVNLCFKML